MWHFLVCKKEYANIDHTWKAKVFPNNTRQLVGCQVSASESVGNLIKNL